MPPANEMTAPQTLTASNMTLVECQIHVLLVDVQRNTEMEKKKDNKGAKKTKAEKVKRNSIFSREGRFLSSEKSALVFFLGPCF